MKTDSSLTPTDDENTLHIFIGNGSISMQDLADQIEAKFGTEIDFADLTCEVEHFHARHITYDLYDSSDYDNYFVVTKIK